MSDNYIDALNLPPARLRRNEWIWRAMIAGMLAVGLILIWDFRWAAVAPSWLFILKGLGVSLWLSLICIGLGALIAVPLAVLRVYGPWGLRHGAVGLIEGVRAIPELMIIFWVFFSAPRLSGNSIDGWTAAIIAMTAIAAAYLAEVLRAGLMSVPTGQWEAGVSTGLSRPQVLFAIIIPQALRNMLPALIGQLIMLFKTTSLVYIVGVVEFFKTTQIVNANVYAPFATYTILAVGYYVCCSLLSYLIYRIDPKYTAAD